MPEQALPLESTDSIAPGRSVPAMLELAANLYKVPVSDELLAAWGAVNQLYTHIDNRLDRDYPEYKPEGAPDQFEWGNWFAYLQNPNPEAAVPEDGNLTEVQQQAFAAMRKQFGILGTPPEQRSEFVTTLQMYMEASEQAKAAPVVGGRDGLAYWRKRDGLAVARLFTSIVPEAEKHSPGANFGRFVHLAEYMIRAYKLFDSVNDMGRDRAHGNNSLRHPTADRISLLGRTAVSFAAIIAPPRHWRLAPAAFGKLVAVIRNRKGNLNDQRTKK